MLEQRFAALLPRLLWAYDGVLSSDLVWHGTVWHGEVYFLALYEEEFSMNDFTEQSGLR